MTISGDFGYEETGPVLGHDYLYWNAGLTWFVHKYAALGLRYYDTLAFNDQISNAPLADGADIENHFVISISVGF